MTESLKQQLKQDLMDAMRAGDTRRKMALRLVLTSIQLAEAETGEDLSDAEIVALIRKEVGRREGALELVREAGRDDLEAVDVAELEILRAYLPRLMTADEIKEVAQEVIAEVGATSPADLGVVMGNIMPRVRGKADGRLVNQTVRELLSA